MTQITSLSYWSPLTVVFEGDVEGPAFWPRVQDLKTWTTLTMYCLQMGHSLMRLPQRLQVTMCPHSSSTQSTG